MPAYSPVFLGLVLLTAAACSTENNTGLTRAYHNLTSKYNIYFNGYESFRRGLKKAEKAVEDDYTRLLPVFPVSAGVATGAISPEMERAIRKASKVITQHSITARPKEKNRQLSEKEQAFYEKNEYNKWIDDAYLLMGKSQFFMEDLYLAERTYRHIIEEYDDAEVRTEARIWLARTYMELGNMREAERALNLAEARRDLPRKLNKLLHAASADFQIRQERYASAITNLEKALTLARKKKDKTRYAFILAQLYEKTGNRAKASSLYRQVIKMNPPYEMTFNARINLAGTFDIENRDSREIRKELRKMLRDEKNEAFRDQIYYALGRLSYREGNLEEAIRLFRESARTSLSNTTQKGISYLAIADIYFSRVHYREAKTYYDSAVTFLNADYPGYQQIFSKSRNLNQLISYVETVEREDSLQYVASLDVNARNQFIDRLIQKVREEEQQQRQQEMEVQRNTMQYYQNQARFRDQYAKSGKWYFYNQATIGLGQMEFKRKWGERKLEDNWRRANKSQVSFGENGTNTPATGQDALTTGETADNKNREYYLKDLPLTDSLMQISHRRLMEALYGAGQTYREFFNDYPRAIESFEELNRRYPDHPHRLETYYALYQMYSDAGNNALASRYKSKIISEFPGTEIAGIVSDPDYFRRQRERLNQLEQAYREVYSLYQNRRYEEVITRTDSILEQYHGNDLTPKLRYLRAVATGRISNVRVLKNELTALMEDYPTHEVAQLAGQVIELIREKNPDIRQEEEEKLAEQIYRYNPEDPHYVLLLVDPAMVDLRRLTFSIINFNIEYYTNANYETMEEDFGNQLKIFTVREFPNRQVCEEYLENLLNTPGVWDGTNLPPGQPLMISAGNYAALMSHKSFTIYLSFYKKQYLRD
ncbi:MAG: tetratricopeptide repeat protein [Bacteroidales bacterium]